MKMESKFNPLPRKENVLLVKGDVGSMPPSTRTLPSNEYAFGKAAQRDAHGAGALTSEWLINVPSMSAMHRDKDFRQLNKLGLK